MKPLNLYELDERLAEVEAMLMASGGDIDDETDARYTELLDAREDKTRAYVALIRNFAASAEAAKAERVRLQKVEKAYANAAASLKARLLGSMITRGETGADSGIGKLTVGYAAPPVQLTSDELPDRFVRVERKPDLTAIKEALANDDPEAAAVACFGERTPFLRLS